MTSPIGQPPRRRTEESGWTLVELLLVIVLLGVVASVAVPGLRGALAWAQVTTAAQELSAVLRFARARAIVERAVHRVRMAPERGWYWIERAVQPGETDADADGFVRVSARGGQIYAVPGRVRVETTVDEIRCYPDGGMDEATVVLQAPGDRVRTVTTAGFFGRVRVVDGAVAE